MVSDWKNTNIKIKEMDLKDFSIVGKALIISTVP